MLLIQAFHQFFLVPFSFFPNSLEQILKYNCNKKYSSCTWTNILTAVPPYCATPDMNKVWNLVTGSCCFLYCQLCYVDNSSQGWNEHAQSYQCSIMKKKVTTVWEKTFEEFPLFMQEYCKPKCKNVEKRISKYLFLSKLQYWESYNSYGFRVAIFLG